MNNKESKSNINVFSVANLRPEEDLKIQAVLDKYPKFLPIGSIVILKKGWKKLMITGYTPVDVKNGNKMYDYVGCLYPEGNLGNDFNLLFNHEDIKQIIAIGLIDAEQKDFMKDLKDLMSEK